MAGMNSGQLKKSYVLGMYWFIFSEVMFFASVLRRTVLRA
jgi:cytochrome c oxidase subunit 3